jgi:hypothetical protein
MSPAQAEAYIALSHEWSVVIPETTINAVQMRFGLTRREAEQTAKDAERRAHRIFNERMSWPVTGGEWRDWR